MILGASVWPFKWDPPHDEVIPRIAKLGYKAVELIAWTEEQMADYTPARIKVLRRIMEGEGLELSELVAKNRGMASPDRAGRDKALDYFKRHVEVARELGTTTVNTVSDTPFAMDLPILTVLPLLQKFEVAIPSGLDWDRNWMDYVDSMRQAAEICQDAGVRYALEPHPYCHVSNTASMLRLLDQVESDSLGMNFDVSQLFPLGEIPQASAYQLGSRIFHTHFSDNDGATNVHWRPGAGKIDWAAVMHALRDVGYDGVISIEIEDATGVSRGSTFMHGVYQGSPVATEAFDRENRIAIRYIKQICEEEGIFFL